MMTGKSESAIEEDDEEAVPAISMSKAINSSCINFKRNNMLPQISQTMTSNQYGGEVQLAIQVVEAGPALKIFSLATLSTSSTNLTQHQNVSLSSFSKLK